MAGIEQAIKEYEQEHRELVQQLKNQPKPQDINDAVLDVLQSLFMLWQRVIQRT